MITIDTQTQAIVSSGKIQKNLRKEEKVKFTPGKQLKEVGCSDTGIGIADVSGMLFLQEIDQHAEDKQNLEEFAKKAFKALKDLQLDLLEGKVSGHRLYSLKDVINNNQFILNLPELNSLAEQIKLRIEVEIAKIETTVT